MATNYIEMKQPVVGEAITAAGFGDVVKNKIERFRCWSTQSFKNLNDHAAGWRQTEIPQSPFTPMGH
jgi:hypothetical protein